MKSTCVCSAVDDWHRHSKDGGTSNREVSFAEKYYLLVSNGEHSPCIRIAHKFTRFVRELIKTYLPRTAYVNLLAIYLLLGAPTSLLTEPSNNQPKLCPRKVEIIMINIKQYRNMPKRPQEKATQLLQQQQEMLLQQLELQRKQTNQLQQSIRTYPRINEWNAENESANYELNPTFMQNKKENTSNAISEIKKTTWQS